VLAKGKDGLSPAHTVGTVGPHTGLSMKERDISSSLRRFSASLMDSLILWFTSFTSVEFIHSLSIGQLPKGISPLGERWTCRYTPC
jgi:hypothetical protein